TSFDAANWCPATRLSYLLSWELFGLAPAGWHATDALLHALAAALLLLALHRMTGDLARSAFVAALFALHPLRAESVAWAAERRDVLAAFAWTLAMLAYAGYARQPSAGRYLAVAAAHALGLAAKPMGVTLPFALLLLDVWPLRRVAWPGPAGWRRAIAEKLP